MATAADMDNVNCSEPLVEQNDCITRPVESQPVDTRNKSEINKSTTPSSTGTDENTCGGSKASESGPFRPPHMVSALNEETREVKTQSTQELQKAEYKEAIISHEVLATMAENFLITTQLPVGELESNLQAVTTGEAVGNLTVETCQSPSKEHPSWSLPGPEETLKMENARKDIADSTVEQAAESGFFSVEGNLRTCSVISSIVQAPVATNTFTSSFSLVPEAENQTIASQCKIAASSETESREEALTASSLLTESSHQPPHSSRDYTLVTGLQRSCHSNAVVVVRPPVSHNLDSDQGSGNPTESDHDDTETSGLLEELKKKNESLELKVSFLEKELQKKDTVHADLKARCKSLQHTLEMKEVEGKCLIEYISKQQERYLNAWLQEGTLRKENLKLSEEFNLVIQQKEQLESDMQKLQVECDHLRLESEKRHDIEMEKEKVVLELTVKTEQLENCEVRYTRLQQELEEFQNHILAQLRDYKMTSEEYKTCLKENMDRLAASHEMVRKTTQELSEKSAQLENYEAQYIRSQQELEESEKEIEEFQSMLKENTDMLAENHDMLRKAIQMWQWKQEECENLEARYQEECENLEAENTSLHQGIKLIALNCKLEKQKCKKRDVKLDKASEQVKELQLKLEECERRKLDAERKMEDLSLASHDAVTDRINVTEKIRKLKKLARARNNRMKIELTLAIDKRKGKRMAQGKKKPYVYKWPWKEREEGAGGGDGEGVKWEEDEHEHGGTSGGHESQNDSNLNSTWPRKEQGGEGGEKEELETQSQEAHNDGDMNSTWPRKEQEGGEGGEKEELEGQGQEAHNDGPLNSTAPNEEKADDIF